MRSYGKLEEFKASIFHAINPFEIAFGGGGSQTLRWNPDANNLENYDTNTYLYNDTETDVVRCLELGWYDVRITVDYEQNSGGRDSIYGYIEADNDDNDIYAPRVETLSFGYIRNNASSSRLGTLHLDRVIKVIAPETRLRYRILSLSGGLNMFVPIGGASIFLQWLRPLQDGESTAI